MIGAGFPIMRFARIVEAHWYIVKITAFLERLIAAQGCFRALQSLIFRPTESASFYIKHLSQRCPALVFVFWLAVPAKK